MAQTSKCPGETDECSLPYIMLHGGGERFAFTMNPSTDPDVFAVCLEAHFYSKFSRIAKHIENQQKTFLPHLENQQKHFCYTEKLLACGCRLLPYNGRGPYRKETLSNL